MTRRPLTQIGVLATLWAVLVPLTAGAQGHTTTHAFAPGGTVELALSAGEYHVAGSPDNFVRIEWTTRPGYEDEVSARIDVSGKVAQVKVVGPNNDFAVRILVPQRSHLVLNLTAGELEIADIEGNKNVDVRAGEVRIRAGDRAKYGHVEASVTVGELHPGGFGTTQEGLLRNFEWKGKGSYELRAHLMVGELRID